MSQMVVVKTKKTTKVRKKKGEVPKGYHPCSSCGGSGIKANVGRKPSK